MKNKRITRLTAANSVVLVFAIWFGAVSADAYAFDVKQSSNRITQLSEKEKNKDIISDPYSAYFQYGIIYDEKTDNLFYNLERIRYFEDNSTFYNGNGTINGSLIFHTDKTGDGKIDIYIVRNSQNELTGIRVATDEEFMEKLRIISAHFRTYLIMKNMG